METIDLTRIGRDEAIDRIRKALKQRSGKSWSVRGGRGTAWGWITIESPPRRRTVRSRLKAGAIYNRPEDYEMYDSGELGGYMTIADRAELATLLGFDLPVHLQGVRIAAGNDYYREYVDRSEGRTPSVIGQQYWD